MKETKEIIFTCNPENEGIQKLEYNNKVLHVILRNANRMKTEQKKYRITIEEIKEQS